MENNQPPITIQPLSLTDIFPQSWLSNPENVVWMTGYVVMGMYPSSEEELIKTIFLDDIKIIFIYGQLKYVAQTQFDVASEPDPRFYSTVEEKSSRVGGHLLILHSINKHLLSEEEPNIRSRIRMMSGLIAAVFGQNAVYYHSFDNIFDPNTGQRKLFGQTTKNPLSLPRPDLQNDRLALFADAYQHSQTLSENERNRIFLSLQWYMDAIQSFDVDVFIKFWLAIETLGFSDRENIKPISESLGRSYQISPKEANQKFGVGRLYSFRNRIVHRGERFPINSLLSDYTEAIYLDVLYERLGLSCEKKAESILNNPDFNLSALIFS